MSLPAPMFPCRLDHCAADRSLPARLLAWTASEYGGPDGWYCRDCGNWQDSLLTLQTELLSLFPDPATRRALSLPAYAAGRPVGEPIPGAAFACHTPQCAAMVSYPADMLITEPGSPGPWRCQWCVEEAFGLHACTDREWSTLARHLEQLPGCRGLDWLLRG